MYHINGCTDKDAINYDSKANRDDGSCRYYVYGCMDEIIIMIELKKTMEAVSTIVI